MKQKIEEYIEVSTFLGDGKSEHLLKKMLKRVDEKQFYLPFIGQFSSGKSRLINNILGRTILPTNGNETTALTTYISFSEREEVFVESVDQQFQSITFEQLLHLSQTKIGKNETINDLLKMNQDAGSFPIKAVHVKINHPILQTGLVIIDTPGINTIIQSHEELTYSILPEAQYLVYVLGKSLSEQDMTMLKKIKGLGIDLVLIRTKLDDLKSNEETVEETIEKDQSILTNQSLHHYRYFGVSNETELFSNSDWGNRFEAFVSFLSKELNENLMITLTKSIEMRLANFSTHFSKQLANKLHVMESHADVTTESLADKIWIIESNMKSLGREARTTEKEIVNHIEPFKQEIVTHLRKSKIDYLTDFRNEMVSHKHSTNLQKLGVQKANEYMDLYVSKANETIESKFQSIIKSTYDVNNEKVAEITAKINEQFQGGIQLNSSELNLSEIQEEKNYVMEQLEGEIQEIIRFMNKSDDELQKYDLKREEINEVLEHIGYESAAAKEEVNDLGAYETQYNRIEGNTNVSDTLKKIGNVADWALVLIPGKAITTAGTKLAKVATKTATALKMGEKAIKATTKIVEGASKLEKSFAKYKKMKEVVADKTEGESGILDLLTLEYWFQKAGTLFDEPPRMEVDRNYQYVYENTKQELTHKYQSIMHKELKQLEELDLIKTKEEKAKKEIELKQRYLRQMEQDLKREEVTIRNKAKVKAAEQFIDSLVEMFEGELLALNQYLVKELETGINQMVEDITISVTTDVQKQLESLKKNLQELVSNRDKTVEELEAQKVEMEKYLAYLV